MGADPTKGKPGAPTAGGRAVAPPAVNSDSSAVGHPARSASLGGFEATDKPRLEATASSAGPRLADASSPARTLAERLPAPLRKLPPWVLLGAPLGLIVLLVAILGLSGTARKTEPAASKSATKRASTAGIAAPAEAQKQRQLGQTYIEQKNGVEALGAFANAFAFDKNSVTEGDIKQAAALALNVPDSAEAVISLLESRLGAPGVDALYSLESRPGPSQLKARVAQSLSKPELRAHASRAASIALALRAADQCEARRALLPRAAREGDQRTLEQLKLMAQRQNCGPMGLVDCWTCLRQDTALQKAITAIEARLKARN